jgi:hypothetical protein
MVLSLHEKRVTLLQEVDLGGGVLVSVDSSGTVAMWESHTCYCSRSAHLPQLASQHPLQACFLASSGALLPCHGVLW